MGPERFARSTRGVRTRYDPVSPRTRGGRRTRTLVRAVYGRGNQPVEYPGVQKSRPRWPRAAVSRSICGLLHSRPAFVIAGHARIAVFGAQDAARRGSCRSYGKQPIHRSASTPTILAEEGFTARRFSGGQASAQPLRLLIRPGTECASQARRRPGRSRHPCCLKRREEETP